MTVIVVIAYILIGVVELYPLYHKKQKKDFWVAVGIGALSFAIALCLSLGVDIPSPEKPIRNLITTITGKQI